MKLTEKAQASLNKVIERFQKGDLSPITAVARIKLDPSAPASQWSFANMVLAYAQAEELDCRGFRQWEAIGRKVKKGSTAVYIFRPQLVKIEKDDDNGKKERREICIGFSSIPVFAARDTEGETPLPSYQPVALPPLFEVAKKYSIAIEYLPVSPKKLGDTRPDGSEIHLGSHDPSVFFHELAHAIHAQITGGLKGGQHADQETVAEFTAAVLMDFYGLGDYSGNTWQYISMYAKDPLTAITKALGTVENVLTVLLE